MADVDIPEWAVDRALERFPRPTYYAGTSWKPAVLEGRNIPFANAVRFLAEQIARHEEPPVDPLLIEARKICTAESCGTDYTTGELDDWFQMRCAYAALKRGMELAQTEK